MSINCKLRDFLLGKLRGDCFSQVSPGRRKGLEKTYLYAKPGIYQYFMLILIHISYERITCPHFHFEETLYTVYMLLFTYNVDIYTSTGGASS